MAHRNFIQRQNAAVKRASPEIAANTMLPGFLFGHAA
jgi:hypothetical protein